MIMHRGKFGELIFNALPGFTAQVMIPALNSITKIDVKKYIEEHFDINHQMILKKELEDDQRKKW
jgi:hypothetical protein